jgi:hypothetical protein
MGVDQVLSRAAGASPSASQGCAHRAAHPAPIDAIAQRFTSWLLEKEVGTAAGRSCHRHVDKVAAVGTHKLIKSFDAIVSAGMAITVDDDEASAPDDDGRQSGGIAVPPLAFAPLGYSPFPASRPAMGACLTPREKTDRPAAARVSAAVKFGLRLRQRPAVSGNPGGAPASPMQPHS